MASTLFDTLKQNLGADNTLGQTNTVRSLLQAKSGKQTTPGSAPAQSSLQEKLAVNQALVGGQQAQQTEDIQKEQLSQQTLDVKQQQDISQKQYNQQLSLLKQDAETKTNDILSQLERGQKQLGSQEYQNKLEQAAFNIRLQNDNYVNQLQDIGTRNRLDDMSNFKEQYYKQVFKDNSDLLEDGEKFKMLMQMNDAEFKQMLGNMDINYAMDMAKQSASQQSMQNIFTGAGNLASGGIQAYMATKNNEKQ